MGDLLDAPNQQVVRPDGSGPGDEGAGGSAPAPDTPDTGAGAGAELDGMTKDELLEYAADHGVDADASMTKAQIRDAIGG